MISGYAIHALAGFSWLITGFVRIAYRIMLPLTEAETAAKTASDICLAAGGVCSYLCGMYYFRQHHISRFLTVLLFCGWLAMLLPSKYDLRSSNAITYWLNQHVATNHDGDAGQKIREIREYRSDIRSFVYNAADVISRNTDLFDLPFDNTGDTDLLARHLLLAISQTQDTGMNDHGVLNSYSVRHFLTPKSIQLAWVPPFGPERETGQAWFVRSVSGAVSGTAAFLLSPLASGISIGAP
jgi:hypothetical protein